MNIKIPFVRFAPDYHEFQEIKNLLNSLGDNKVKYAELSEYGPYHAVFYVGRKPDDTTIKNLIEKL